MMINERRGQWLPGRLQEKDMFFIKTVLTNEEVMAGLQTSDR